MGFLRRVFGRSDETGASFNVSYFTRVRDDASLHVVGEAYRQENVALARPPGPDELPPGVPPPPAGYFKAMLFAQPNNQYDRNAIAVALWAGRSWSHVGYLSREDAAGYQPVFRHLAQASESKSPPAVTCNAALRDERGGAGVVLNLGTPAECIVDNVVEERAPMVHPWTDKSIAFTGNGVTTIHGIPLDRAAQIMLAQWAACEVLPRLTKKTAVLVAASPNDTTGNLVRARDYGIPIVDERAFLIAIGIPEEMIGRAERWARG